MLRYIKQVKKSKARIDWVKAPDIKDRVLHLQKKLHLDWLKPNNIYTVRSTGANTRAVARIWGLSRIWQITLKSEPKYIIEVISEKFDRLGQTDRDKVLIHEIVHIPKNFSGSLMPHIRRGKNKFSDKLKYLVAQYYNK